MEEQDTRLDYDFFGTYDIKEIVDMVVLFAILDGLDRNDWNQTKTADELNMSRKTLNRKLSESKIVAKKFKRNRLEG